MSNSERISELDQRAAGLRLRLDDLEGRIMRRILNIEYEIRRRYDEMIAQKNDLADEDVTFDATNPDYYKLPNGVETVETSEWLTSNGGQAVQYIVRATRIDGVTKTNPLEDLRKARWFIDREISRMEQHARD